MRKFNKVNPLGFMLLVAVLLFGLSSVSAGGVKEQSVVFSDSTETVVIEDVHQAVTVPINPKRVVALDNRTFETLEDWGYYFGCSSKGSDARRFNVCLRSLCIRCRDAYRP
ncbi:MAG: hypothetical protein WCY81_05515 [Sphaerochaetaceae bacterium]|jgi:iron complex transport system substrate-binding protein